MSKEVLVPVADGTEELEAIAIVDILRRAGMTVTIASVDEGDVTMSRGVRIDADTLIEHCTDMSYDLVVLPGGSEGARKLRASTHLGRILKRQAGQGKMYAAICASPAIVLKHHGLLDGHKATCHPDFVEELDNKKHVEERVVVDGNLVTSRGPGTAVEFALKLVELLDGKEKADAIGESMVVGTVE
jgi:protein deglycase